MRRSRLTCAVLVSAIATGLTSPALAEEPSPTAEAPAAAPATPPNGLTPAAIDLDKDTQSAALADVPAAPAEAPPPLPYKKTVVIDSSVGALVFLGKFGETAPPSPWIRMQVGYELFKWLMFFGEGELGFTDTSGSQAPPRTRTFPLFGFGGGGRFTARFTDRFGVYLQGSLGAMKADIRARSLDIIGYGDAESLGLYLGGRLGLEWYQIDRHFALGVNAGLRTATNFKLATGASDTPLAFDAGASIRYAF